MKNFCRTLILMSLLIFSIPVMALETTPAAATPPPVKATPLLKTSESWNHKALAYPTGKPEVTSLLLEIQPGAETGWHLHPIPCVAYLLQGTLEVSLKDGQVNHIEAGQSIAEVVNTLHNGKNVGKDVVKIVVFFIGAQGTPLTVKEADVEK